MVRTTSMPRSVHIVISFLRPYGDSFGAYCFQAAEPTATRLDVFASQLANVPAIAALNLGPLFKSSQPVDLTESETEYVVQCIKHVFGHHVVLQVLRTNTTT
jgi:hypothetical protein